MSPVLLYNLVIILIVTFQYFTQAYTLTNGRGDPNNATLFINLELYPRGVRLQPDGLRRGDRLAAVRDRPGPDASSCSRSPGSASTTPAASDDDASPRRTPRSFADRGPVARAYRRYLGKASLFMFAMILVSAFLLPLLYMVTTAFQQPGQRTTPGAPV